MGSREIPQKIWARSVQPFRRLLDTNKQTDKQTDKQNLYIDADKSNLFREKVEIPVWRTRLPPPVGVQGAHHGPPFLHHGPPPPHPEASGQGYRNIPPPRYYMCISDPTWNV